MVNAEKIFWTHINVELFEKKVKENGFNLLMLKEIKENPSQNGVTLKNLRLDEVYQGVELYDVCIYNICNDLEIFKNELCINVHSKTIAKWYNIARKTIDFLKDILREEKVVGAIIFHGHLLFDACLLTLCKKYEIKYLTLEITAHRNKLVWDNLSGFVVSYNLAKNYFYKYTLEPRFIEEAKSYCQKYLRNINTYKSLEHSSKSQTNFENPFFPKPYVLFLCQVYNDASQLFTLEGDLNNPISIINAVSQISREMDTNVIIKIHPKEKNGKNPITRKPYREPTFLKLKELDSTSHIFIDRNNDLNTYDLIKKATVVVTVNSQAGLESAIYNKPVLSYYKGFFAGLGFTYDYSDLKSLRFKLKSLLEDNILKNRNLNAARSFFFIFNEYYCIEKTENALYSKIVESFELRTPLSFKVYYFIKTKTYPFRHGFKKKLHKA